MLIHFNTSFLSVGLGAGFFAVCFGSPVDVVKSRVMGMELCAYWQIILHCTDMSLICICAYHVLYGCICMGALVHNGEWMKPHETLAHVRCKIDLYLHWYHPSCKGYCMLCCKGDYIEPVLLHILQGTLRAGSREWWIAL